MKLLEVIGQFERFNFSSMPAQGIEDQIFKNYLVRPGRIIVWLIELNLRQFKSLEKYVYNLLDYSYLSHHSLAHCWKIYGYIANWRGYFRLNLIPTSRCYPWWWLIFFQKIFFSKKILRVSIGRGEIRCAMPFLTFFLWWESTLLHTCRWKPL